MGTKKVAGNAAILTAVGRALRASRTPYGTSTTTLKNRMVGRAVPGEPPSPPPSHLQPPSTRHPASPHPSARPVSPRPSSGSPSAPTPPSAHHPPIQWTQCGVIRGIRRIKPQRIAHRCRPPIRQCRCQRTVDIKSNFPNFPLRLSVRFDTLASVTPPDRLRPIVATGIFFL